MVNESKHRRRGGLKPLTSVRAYRLERGITLIEVAARSGLSTFRVSVIERDPDVARPAEIDAHHAAVDTIAAERGLPVKNSDDDATKASIELATVALQEPTV